MVKVFCISLEFCSALQLCIVAKGKGELRMKKEWVKLKTAVNMAAAMEVLTFMSFLFLFCLFCRFLVFFFVFFCFVMAASTSPFYHQYQLHHHHYHHHDDHHYQGDKEESDEDEEIYVIEPKPEPKFRHQIFRDKERVIQK